MGLLSQAQLSDFTFTLLEKEMATYSSTPAWKIPVSKSQTQLSDFTFTFMYWIRKYSSILAWSIPGTEEPSGLPSMGSHRVGHN